MEDEFKRCARCGKDKWREEICAACGVCVACSLGFSTACEACVKREEEIRRVEDAEIERNL